MKDNILVIEDDALLNRLISEHLERIGYAAHSVHNARQAELFLKTNDAKLVLTDVRLPDADGLELLPHLSAEQPVIVLTAYGSVNSAVQAMKSGAAEYLVKPINLNELELVVKRVLDAAAQRGDLAFCKQTLNRHQKTAMIGDGAGLSKVHDLIEAVAPSQMTVLIHGESGVGKELVARAIHDRSTRSGRHFVIVDCCTLQEQLFESGLFGHEPGAFTGASNKKQGLIEGAEGGTLFLDEVGEVAPSAQAKLLRVLETGQFRRVGGVRDRQANVRVVTATNRDLAELTREGKFRNDLFYRLNGFEIEVPPIRERREDIPGLVDFFVRNHNFSRRIEKQVTQKALTELISYEWPGNIREMKNVIERAIILSGDSPEIDTQHLSIHVDEMTTFDLFGLNFEQEPTLAEIERRYLEMLLKKHDGRRATVASVMGISERNIYRLVDKYKLK